MGVKIHTIPDIRRWINNQLAPLYPPGEIKALTGIIIKTLFNTGRLHQLTEPDQNITPDIMSRLLEITEDLKSGRPIQYILGETTFFDCPIKVSQGVLIPRQETEELVDLIIKDNPDFRGRITDIGTGSGCIAIALAKNIRGAEITGTDISDIAIRTAKLNGILNDVEVAFIKADILDYKDNNFGKASILVSNPPYVRESEKQVMSNNVLDYEPWNALFVPDNDPLIFYRYILGSVPVTMEPGGKIYFEINEAMGKEIYSLMMQSGFESVSVIKDLNGKDRIAKGIYHGN